VNISCRGTEEKLHIIGLMTMIRVKGHMHNQLKLEKLLVCFKLEAVKHLSLCSQA